MDIQIFAIDIFLLTYVAQKALFSNFHGKQILSDFLVIWWRL